uniref:Uncharacterized protein n=1 Tax=Trichobilharzia regenti TaxID=157069 RepID=A0AA85JZM7_TRIRE|nr:unnamed protein product [Trichobilharzia regenti]
MFSHRIRLFSSLYSKSPLVFANADAWSPTDFCKYFSKISMKESERTQSTNQVKSESFYNTTTTSTTEPFHCLSNIQPPRLKSKSSDDTPLELKYRKVYEETWRWLDEYWSAYNLSYIKAKNAFLARENMNIKDVKADDSCERKGVTDLGAFHRQFLEENKQKRIHFNLQWYRRIAYIVYLSILVDFQQVYNRLRYTLFPKQKDLVKKENGKVT